MGALTSRQNPGVEEIDVTSNHAYKYPPRSGNYFGSHFIMGGERFDTPQPESYLFGENSDLNFLGSRPTSFPYPPPQANEPTKTLKSLVNIRKESLRFVRAPPDYSKIEGDQSERDLEVGKGSLFNIEFTFDCDVRCAITIYYFCTEEITNNGVTYVPRDASMNSETYHYKRGANQQFCQMSHCFDPSRYNEEELLFNTEKEIIPIAIHCIAEEGSDEIRQSHTTIAIIEKHTDGAYVLKALKQKLFVDGLCYLLQEIYGIENKNNDTKITGDEETEDNGSECVICMSDVRDTLILPCRHLCLCNSCADSLRYQANNCPICRAPFRALLQIRALQKTTGIVQQAPTSPPEGSCDNIPPGYEAVSLIEALNGPCLRQPPSAVLDMVETPDTETAVAVQAADCLNRVGNEDRLSKSGKDDKRNGSSGVNSTPEFRMSVLLSRDDEIKETQKSPLLADQSGYRVGKNPRPRDSVRHVNEKNISLEKDETQDDDSEAEKLSPLLHTKESGRRDGNLALDMAGVVESIDDTDTEHESPTPTSVKAKIIVNTDQEIPVREERAEESDYYTPEDPAPSTTVLSPLYAEKEREKSTSTSLGVNSTESTPHKLAGAAISLPGTPLSHVSVRSSGDSYGSSSSTKHLLAVAQSPVVMHDKSVQI